MGQNFSVEKWLPALILSIGIVLSSAIVSSTLFKIKRMDNTITVTGSAKVRVVSDQVRWTITISRITPTLSEGYSLMAKDLSKIKEFLTKKGIQEKEIEISQIYTNQPWLYTERLDRMHYQFTQSIVVSSMEVEKVLALADKIYDLVPDGVNITSSNLEFYYSKLPELRVSLLNDAMIDAKQRATMIAKSTGRKVGKVKSARMGVVQVMAPNTIQISDYGTYNTESREKEVMITVQATFYLK
uniref:SIMPL domain-containing protein n=1 Tax=candidate division WOR-3 bacterium TaxID=2052148 RepID=A0A7V3ZZG9_UNCW3